MKRITIEGFNFTSDFVASNLQSYPIAEALTRLQEYEDVGSVEEFTELKELQTPKKPSAVDMQNKCPNIDCFENVLRYYDYCSSCGQKIDWSKD